MARPLSEAKREAILMSATRLVAALGIGAPTAKIAQGADIAEGTLFKYFATKDDLLNEIYLTLKTDLAKALNEAFPTHAEMRERGWHIWSHWIDWGAKYPDKRKAMRQLSVSERITTASRQAGTASFREVSATLEKAIAAGPLQGQPLAFVGALFESLAEATVEFVARDPDRREQYKQAGFHMLWSGLSP
ncbi:TetR family transcriptional regulator [Labrys miyagiensis]